MWMKNERRYRGIIRAQMKDLGVFLPKGFGDEEGRCEGVKKRKKEKKENPTIRTDCIMPLTFVLFVV